MQVGGAQGFQRRLVQVEGGSRSGMDVAKEIARSATAMTAAAKTDFASASGVVGASRFKEAPVSEPSKILSAYKTMLANSGGKPGFSTKV
jgi:hypothetical protein